MGGSLHFRRCSHLRQLLPVGVFISYHLTASLATTVPLFCHRRKGFSRTESPSSNTGYTFSSSVVAVGPCRLTVLQFDMRCAGLLPAHCVGVLRIIAMNGSDCFLLHSSILCLAAFTLDSALPFALACPGAPVQCSMSNFAVNSRNVSAVY